MEDSSISAVTVLPLIELRCPSPRVLRGKPRWRASATWAAMPARPRRPRRAPRPRQAALRLLRAKKHHPQEASSAHDDPYPHNDPVHGPYSRLGAGRESAGWGVHDPQLSGLASIQLRRRAVAVLWRLIAERRRLSGLLHSREHAGDRDRLVCDCAGPEQQSRCRAAKPFEGSFGAPVVFTSADSTNIAPNHAGVPSKGIPRRDPQAMAGKIDGLQCPSRWQNDTQRKRVPFRRQ